ncbi:hypothetical protein [Streptomyces anulatus]|uniref:hypothetical protein n=1 Tax=Streptomyces anulatus TaxID=1892 RepID=UPI003415ED58
MDDELLMWCSERGDGSLAAFHETYAWLASRAQGRQELDWRIALYNLQALGHVEIDWENNRWSVTPPVLTSLANSAGHSLLVGQRPLWLLDRLDNLQNDPAPQSAQLAQSVLPLPAVGQQGGPSVRLVATPDLDDARALCEALGIYFQDRTADQLARRLPGLREMLAQKRGALRGPGGVEPQRMSDGNEIWEDIEGPGEPPLYGAYRYQRYNTKRYVYWIGDLGFVADKRAVIYAQLARSKRWVLRYDAQHQELYSPIRMQLPQLHARAAVLRSGLLPQPSSLRPSSTTAPRRPESGRSHFVKYVNIDEPFARMVADSLHQELQFVS